MGRKYIDLVGKTFGMLTVICRSENDKVGRTRWLCRCLCGKEVVVNGDNLRRGVTNSCGCNRNERIKESNTKHGEFGTRLYNTWGHMIQRCTNPKNKDYGNYGGRGITVCDEWRKDFRSFCEWAVSNGYCDDLTLDREDVNGNYEPSNCRWSNHKEQCNNKRTNCMITYAGKTQTLMQWAEELNLNYSITYQRIFRDKWTIERAFSGGGVL